MRLIITIILFLALVPPLLHAQSVGASMALEGRAAITRAATFLIARQRENGSWEDSPALTSLAGQSLLSANSFMEDDGVALAVSRALSFIRTSPVDSGWREAVRLRLLLEPETQTDETALREAFASLRQQSFPPPPDGAVWLADILLQFSRRPNATVSLERLADSSPRTSSELLALALMTANHTETSLKALYSAARTTNPHKADIGELYWGARSFQACNATTLFPYDNWKADIIAALLDRQRGDGAWHREKQSEVQIIRDSALAIQTAVLCLND